LVGGNGNDSNNLQDEAKYEEWHKDGILYNEC
jgi:hypothetical protein